MRGLGTFAGVEAAAVVGAEVIGMHWWVMALGVAAGAVAGWNMRQQNRRL